MNADVDNLSNEILEFCLNRAPAMKGMDFDLVHHFANQLADGDPSTLGSVEAGRQAVEPAIAELCKDSYLHKYGNNYRLTGAGRVFAKRHGYDGLAERQDEERDLSQMVSRSVIGTSRFVKISGVASVLVALFAVLVAWIKAPRPSEIILYQQTPTMQQSQSSSKPDTTRQMLFHQALPNQQQKAHP
ncbi:MAG TPA: hypothetical protein VLX91_08960 [Candidatus Acidoferrales bacterium]|nr:hypothetical protein [Candidatus Acidoferrales bacterium]